MREAVKTAVKLVRFKKLVPEQQPEQTAPEHVLAEEHGRTPTAKHASDAGLWVSSECVINHDRAARAEKLRAKRRAAAAILAPIEIRRENKFVVARGIIDHLPQERFRRRLIAVLVEQPDQALVAFCRGPETI